ncbi:TraX family protein [Clostridium sp. C2-6-12]|uniref:TraX family protein n=1 Tax=Clostridium sp. C2-6-12 TaxID=2698832 RepID=UPI0013720EC0|nr:TraX family protein [Clostridium sp. C2-6-12]
MVNTYFVPKEVNSNHLKIIAIIAMAIDHIAYGFVPEGSILGQIMHTIGRITMPIMCFSLAEGYHKTKNLKKYVIRLFIFMIISYIPYLFFTTGKMPISFDNSSNIYFKFPTSVIYTLFIGIISLIVWDLKELNKFLKALILLVLLDAATYGDWGTTCVLWVLVFGIFYGDFKKQIIGYLLVAFPLFLIVILMFFNIIDGVWWEKIYIFGLLLPIPLLSNYNGKLGEHNLKWLFYVFYPLHLLIIGYIKYIVL